MQIKKITAKLGMLFQPFSGIPNRLQVMCINYIFTSDKNNMT